MAIITDQETVIHLTDIALQDNMIAQAVFLIN